ncbi:transcriptional regulator, TetR family [Syntrophothermus lipocalidus DSM 12680]|uniref:Transcriptional regulator, TetR family n=1 Tax=Syntrophothermus lipocalidus (strain DSM 12680 / TGB-C1) TaxID=643648 RepID=D7CPW8_SYNLT|nr:transcriptional regulator, TetR family [Syntrophothermus lipocalidus DSM 12680]
MNLLQDTKRLNLQAKMMEKRKRLLKSALELFAEKGYSNTSVRSIIDRSGLGTGTFYKYFNSKEEILKALLEEFLSQIISSIKNYYTQEKNLYVRFIETKRVTMEVFAQNEKLSEIYCRAAGTSDVIDQCLKEFDDKLIEFSIKNIDYGIRHGIFRNLPVAPIAHAILAVEKYLLYKWIILKAISKEEMLEMVVSFHKSLAIGLVKIEALDEYVAQQINVEDKT